MQNLEYAKSVSWVSAFPLEAHAKSHGGRTGPNFGWRSFVLTKLLYVHLVNVRSACI